MIKFAKLKNQFAKNSNATIAGIDIGASKVCCSIAKINSSGALELVGYGQYGSKGLRGGMIIDMESLQESVAYAVHRAEENANETINNVYLSVSPAICQSKIVGIESELEKRCIEDNDLRKITTQAIESIDKNYTVIQNIPLNYEIDGVSGIKDPRGMFGEHLKTKINLMLCPTTPLRNLSACIERSHLNVVGFVPSIYASGLSTLVQDELDLGVTLIDIGASATSIGLFFNEKLSHIDYIPIGGAHITSDIAKCFSTPIVQAEMLKINYGSAMLSPADGREMITISQIGDEEGSSGQQISRAEISDIATSRVEELLEKIKEKIINHPAHRYVGDILVLTGGGSLLNGLNGLAEKILNKRSRIAKPINIAKLDKQIKNPSFAVGAGLLEYAKHQKGPYAMLASRRNTNNNIFYKAVQWIKNNI